MELYPEYDGRWKCDNCNEDQQKNMYPQHCCNTDCTFDLCEPCARPLPHNRHPHPLFLTNAATIYPNYHGRWKCDACAVVSSGGPDSMFVYHCYTCQWDLCKDCYSGRKFALHNHVLKPTDSRVVYGPSAGMWLCNVCQKSGQDFNSPYAWHCEICEFDSCDDCIRTKNFPEIHNHPLKISDSMLVYGEYEGDWKCDQCNTDYSPGPERPPTTPEEQAELRLHRYPYHCYTPNCDFDICYNCVAQSNHNADGARDMVGREQAERYDLSSRYAQTSPRYTSRHPSIQDEYQIANQHKIEDETEEEDIPDQEKCVICLSRRKTATIVHGITGHVCCCINCAVILQRNRQPCPICRAPIDRVIKQFVT